MNSYQHFNSTMIAVIACAVEVPERLLQVPSLTNDQELSDCKRWTRLRHRKFYNSPITWNRQRRELRQDVKHGVVRTNGACEWFARTASQTKK